MEHLIYSRIYPVLGILILVEALLLMRSGKYRHSWQESVASLGVFIGQHLTNMVMKVVLAGIFIVIWEHRLWTVPLNTWWGLPLLFFGIEFFYYWHHRCAHRVRWLWATHAVHHSTKHFNLSAAYRLGWTGVISGNFLFFLPLIWLGFHPIAVTTGLAFNLVYQFWIHTEIVPKLGFLEWVLNTPSHHRVHHASNPEYIDRNYGGVLILFDRLFGTFTEEQAAHKPIYGLTHSLHTYNPLKIAFHAWISLFQDLWNARTWKGRLDTIFGAPK
ncbi:Fatty acid hydroxylase domain-containing protein [Tumidithrix helvetica PCC 7403]|uniref:sterol desaturase family protein n=1 Tax=Tumidithrix helvetica TaxID=3457545 RepID=UPI003CA29012